MSFPTSVRAQALAACARHCCLCRKFKGLKIELHHITQELDGGNDTFENCVPLCFDCHGDMRSIDHNHPKGNKYTQQELRLRRDQCYALVESGSLPVTEINSTLASRQQSLPVLKTIHGQLRRESNARFGFSFVYPSIWDRQDPTNGDGNTYRHPQDSRIKLAAWGQYGVISPNLHSWVDWTIKCLRGENCFRLITRVPAGGHLVDWKDRERNKAFASYQQVEGYRIVYKTEEDGQPFTTTQTFRQYGDTQVGLCCRAPSDNYEHYEELFLVISKELRILGANSAPFARDGDGGKST